MFWPNSHLLSHPHRAPFEVIGAPCAEHFVGGGCNESLGLLKLNKYLNFSCLNHQVQFSCSVVSDSLQPHGLQHARLPCPSLTARAYSNSSPSHHWCHPTISSSVVPFSSCSWSFTASGSFPVSQFFASGGQNKYWSFSFSIHPSNEHSGLIPLGWTGWISLQSKGLSIVFSNTTVQKHQFFSVQLSL